MSINRRDSRVSIESAEMSCRQLSFENDLFIAKVSKRNYRTALIHTSLHQTSTADRELSLKKYESAMSARAFFYACAGGDVQTVKMLLKEGHDVHAKFTTPKATMSSSRVVTGSKGASALFIVQRPPIILRSPSHY
jgi:hypothetical protein